MNSSPNVKCLLSGPLPLGITQQRAHLQLLRLFQAGVGDSSYPGLSCQYGDDSSELVRMRIAHVALAQVVKQPHPFIPRYRYHGVTISVPVRTAAAALATGRCISLPTISPFSTRSCPAVVDPVSHAPNERQSAGDHSGQRLTGRNDS